MALKIGLEQWVLEERVKELVSYEIGISRESKRKGELADWVLEEVVQEWMGKYKEH